MKIYLAGERLGHSAMGQDQQALWIKHVKNRLYSYYYHGFSGGTFKSKADDQGLTNEVRESYNMGHSLFLDSGAFTAFTKSVTISAVEYARFIYKCQNKAAKEGKETFWNICSSLDFIGSGEEAAQKSYETFKELTGYLSPYGMSVCPVFHVREPHHWLQRYVDEGHQYILIGGMVPETTKWLLPVLDELWLRQLTNPDGTPKIKVHGFGLTDQKLMFRYPWYSVDSSSWLMTGVFGACLFREENRMRKIVFSDESPEARKYKGWHYTKIPEAARARVDSWLEPYGVTATQLSEHYSYRDVINAAVFQDMGDLGATHFRMQQQTLFNDKGELQPEILGNIPTGDFFTGPYFGYGNG